mgnify:CR=1 FL=1
MKMIEYKYCKGSGMVRVAQNARGKQLNKVRYVDVCGIPFKVVEVDSNSRTDMSMGRSDSKMALITINKDMPKEMKESVLIHEWLHSILECQGLSEYSNNEEFVCILQNELYRAGFRVIYEE